MKMKESAGSLKTYFVVIAIIVLIQNLLILRFAKVSLVLLVIGVIGLAFAIAYFYIGFRLRKLLVRSPNRIKYVIYANVVLEILSFAISLQGGMRTAAIVQLILVLLIAWYLVRNISRLALEEQGKLNIVAAQK